MEVSNQSLVRRAIAAHLDIAVDELSAADTLEGDLGLDPLDLVLVALRLEQDVGVEFPVSLLEQVKTVADLDGLVGSWLSVVPTLLRAQSRGRARMVVSARIQGGVHGY